jgi:hypothetical protein
MQPAGVGQHNILINRGVVRVCRPGQLCRGKRCCGPRDILPALTGTCKPNSCRAIVVHIDHVTCLINRMHASCIDDGVLHLCQQGMPVVSIQWGAWGSTGMAANDPSILSRLHRIGLGAIQPHRGLAALQSAVMSTFTGDRRELLTSNHKSLT